MELLPEDVLRWQFCQVGCHTNTAFVQLAELSVIEEEVKIKVIITDGHSFLAGNKGEASFRFKDK